MTVAEERKLILVEKMHLACRKVRLAIAVLEADVVPDESTQTRLDEAMSLLKEVRGELLD